MQTNSNGNHKQIRRPGSGAKSGSTASAPQKRPAPQRAESVAKTVPVKKTAPAAKTAPAKKAAPAAKTAPVKKTAPAAKTAPVKKAAPAAKTAPAKKAAPAAKTAPVKKSAPVKKTPPTAKKGARKPQNQNAILAYLQRINIDVRQTPKRILPALLLGLVFFYNEIVLRICGGRSAFGSLLTPLLSAGGVGLTISAIALLFGPKVERRIRIAVMYVVAAFFITQALIHNSFQQYFSLNEIILGSRGVVTGYSSDLISAIVHGIPVFIAFFLPPVLYNVFGKKLRSIRRFRKPFALQTLICGILVFCLSIGAATAGGNAALYADQFEFTKSTEAFGLLTGFRLSEKYAMFGNAAANQFVTVDAEPTEAPEEALVMEETTQSQPEGYNECGLDFAALRDSETNETYRNLDAYITTLQPSKKNAYTGLFKGKNLILICAEAYNSVVLDPELTPTLYRLIHNGFYFSDAYQPAWGGSTSSGEFSFMMGIAPQNGIQTMQDTINNNNYYTMGSLLNREGYYSVAFHNGTAEYYNRNITHMNLGYDDYIAQDSGLELIAGRYPTDAQMLTATLDWYHDKQPFSVYYMTVSGHAPYANNDDARVKRHIDQVRAKYGNLYSDHVLNYICYQLELEDALTQLVSTLEDYGIADNTVIAMCTDHYPYGLSKSATFKNDRDYTEEWLGTNFDKFARDKTNLIIWSGCLENENKDMACEISAPTSSLDMMPTLANLFGVTFDSRLVCGRDVFSDREALVFWNDHSFITEQGRYNSDTKIYTPAAGYDFDEQYLDRIGQVVTNHLRYSYQEVANDYFGHLFGPSGTEGGVLDCMKTDRSNLVAAGTAPVNTNEDNAPPEMLADPNA